MKRNRSLIAIVMVLLLLFTYSPMVSAASFRDTRGHWAEDYIAYLSSRGILNGDGTGNFRPNKSMSKAEFYAMINRSAGLRKTYTVTFSDVPSGGWYYPEVAKAIKAGYITPTTGRLRPNSPITRQEAMRIFAYMYGMSASDRVLRGFSDFNQINPASRPGAAALVEVGAVGGFEDGTLRPNNAISRGEVARVFSLLLNSYGNPPAKSVLDSKIRFGNRNLHQ